MPLFVPSHIFYKCAMLSNERRRKNLGLNPFAYTYVELRPITCNQEHIKEREDDKHKKHIRLI